MCQAQIESPPPILIAFQNLFDWGEITQNFSEIILDKRWTDEEFDEFDQFKKFVTKIFKDDKILRLQALEMINRIKRNPHYKTRSGWYWTIANRREVTTFIRFISPYCYVKKPQLDRALELLSLNKTFTKGDKIKIKKEFSEAKLLENYQSIKLDSFVVSWAKVAGLFESDGCISVTKDGKSRFSIAQTSSQTLLEKIQKFIGHGIISNKKKDNLELIIYDPEVIITIGNSVMRYLIQKRIQMKIYLYEDSMDWRKSIYRILQVLKRC